MDFVYIEDIARANILAANSTVTDDVFNIGSGTETSSSDLKGDVVAISKKYRTPLTLQVSGFAEARKRFFAVRAAVCAWRQRPQSLQPAGYSSEDHRHPPGIATDGDVVQGIGRRPPTKHGSAGQRAASGIIIPRHAAGTVLSY